VIVHQIVEIVDHIVVIVYHMVVNAHHIPNKMEFAKTLFIYVGTLNMTKHNNNSNSSHLNNQTIF